MQATCCYAPPRPSHSQSAQVGCHASIVHAYMHCSLPACTTRNPKHPPPHPWAAAPLGCRPPPPPAAARARGTMPRSPRAPPTARSACTARCGPPTASRRRRHRPTAATGRWWVLAPGSAPARAGDGRQSWGFKRNFNIPMHGGLRAYVMPWTAATGQQQQKRTLWHPPPTHAAAPSMPPLPPPHAPPGCGRRSAAPAAWGRAAGRAAWAAGAPGTRGLQHRRQGVGWEGQGGSGGGGWGHQRSRFGECQSSRAQQAKPCA